MLSEIGRPVDRLSVKRAVLYPMIFFGGTISFGVVGFLYDTGVLTGGSGYESVAGVASVASLSIGLYLLGQTLLAINKVALLPPSLTAFDVKFYPGQLQSIEIPVGKLSRVEVRIRNFGQEMAESVTAWIVLPLKFDLEAGPYSVTDLGPDDGWSTPCRGAEFSITQIAAESSAILFISVRPQTTGTFSVRVIVLEKKIGTSRHSLTINVT